MIQTPDQDETKDSFASLCETIAALRHPVSGCPWDLEQTHESLRRYMIEEAYEAVEVMGPVKYDKLCEELGDVLLQVVLNSQIAQDQNQFSINDVITGINRKMRRRHPHVFTENMDDSKLASRDKADIRKNWEQIKSQENLSSNIQPLGVFAEIKLHKNVPASHAAVSIGKIAKKIMFDWKDAKEVLVQVESEIAELRHEIDANVSVKRIADEMGDVLFSIAQLCRHLNISPEVCAYDGNQKFLRRFRKLEEIALSKGIPVETAGSEQLENLWKLAKTQEKSLCST